LPLVETLKLIKDVFYH